MSSRASPPEPASDLGQRFAAALEELFQELLIAAGHRWLVASLLQCLLRPYLRRLAASINKLAAAVHAAELEPQVASAPPVGRSPPGRGGPRVVSNDLARRRAPRPPAPAAAERWTVRSGAFGAVRDLHLRGRPLERVWPPNSSRPYFVARFAATASHALIVSISKRSATTTPKKPLSRARAGEGGARAPWRGRVRARALPRATRPPQPFAPPPAPRAAPAVG